MNLIIDIGNSKCKIGIFDEKGNIIHFQIDDINNIDFNNISKLFPNIGCCIFCAVGDFSNKLLEDIRYRYKLKIIDKNTKLTFKNNYSTPETLGIDRKVLAFGANYFYPKKDNLIIDVGSCITYDIITKENEYIGGAISAGINLRFKTMNEFTRALPLVHKTNIINIFENSTKTCIQSGTINGVKYEIQGFINSFLKEYKNPNIILTGGDCIMISDIFDIEFKHGILIDNFFLLKSLNTLASIF